MGISALISGLEDWRFYFSNWTSEARYLDDEELVILRCLLRDVLLASDKYLYYDDGIGLDLL